MKRLLCPRVPSPNRDVELPDTEADHAVKVLRLRDGDRVEALDGKGNAAYAILRVRGGPVRLEFAGELTSLQSSEASPITVEMAILKGDAMEWVVEKSVELGVRKLIPTTTDHTVVQIKQKGPEAFQQRWQKIADQALKQCGRLERIEIAMPLALEELLAREPASETQPRLWFDEAGREETPFLMNWLEASVGQISGVRLLVGPEGGWSADERSLLARSAHTHRISLGPLVFRAETAAIFSISVVSAALRTAKSRT